MNKSPQTIFTGLMLGLAPAIVAGLIYWLAPMLTGVGPKGPVTFAAMILFVFGSFAVFITGILLIVRNYEIAGAIAIVLQMIQLIILIAFLSGGV